MRPRLAADSPSTITIINKKEIQASGARYLGDVLSLVPAVEVQRLSSTESNVSVRGYNDTQATAQGMVAVVDGRNVTNDFLGTTLWDQIAVDLDDIETVAVIRGAGSFAHGRGAMHGMVNIVTKSPLDYEKDYVSIKGQVGTDETKIGALTFVRHEENSDYALKLTMAADDIEHFDPNVDFPRNKRFFELRFESRLDSDPQHRIDISTGIAQQNFEFRVGKVPPISGTSYFSQGQDTFVNARYRNHNLTGQISWTGFNGNSQPLAIYQPFSTDLDSINAELLYSFDELSGHELTIGTGMRFSTFTTDEANVSLGRHDTYAGWLFLQDEWRVMSDLVLTAGLRWDQHSVTDPVFSPRAGLVWEFYESQYARLAYGTGFRPPSLRELWFDMIANDPAVGVPVTINGNLKLRPEKLRSFELGYSGIPIDDFKGAVTGFYNRVDDLVDFVPTGTVIRPENTSDEEAYGFEVEAEYFFSSAVSGFADYANVNRRENAPGHNRIPLAPRHKANLGLRYGGDDLGFSGMIWGHYFSETGLYGEEISGYFLLNGSITYAFLIGKTKARSFIRAINMLDKDHKEHPEGDSLGIMATVGFSMAW